MISRVVALPVCAVLSAALLWILAPPSLAQAPRIAQIQRTANGVAHVEAPDYESLAYGIAYVQAQENVCQTADHLLTIRGERSRYFDPTANGLLGLRPLSNEQIDLFIRAHMDDRLEGAAQSRQCHQPRHDRYPGAE